LLNKLIVYKAAISIDLSSTNSLCTNLRAQTLQNEQQVKAEVDLPES